jgi:UDP-N-acetylglucosamine--dolichyl-phosphate N-acetylglucosaminephosphotransferase
MVLLYTILILSISVFVGCFVLTFFFTHYLVNALRRRGSVVDDFHKLNRPKVASPGGISILFSLVVVESMLFFFTESVEILAIILTTVIAGTIGFLDDFVRLGGKTKPVLLILASLPILLLATYSFRPFFPLFGGVRLPLIYPILVLLAIPIVSNSTNMIDVLNGALSGFMAIATIPLVFALAIKGEYIIMISALPIIASSIAFYFFHKFPSKIFPGDTGSLTLGAIFCSIVIVGGVEIVGIVALLPAILNSFFVISSLKKFIEHRLIKNRPTILLEDGRLAASKELSAPATLVRMILIDGPLSEVKVVHNILKLAAFSAVLAGITALLTWGI